MERSLFRYILRHTWRDQVLLLIVTLVSFPLIYINLEIPKQIVNSAIGGKNIPATFLGFDVTQVSYLMALSILLLALITINGGIKYWLNVFRGVVGERTMRRLRYELYERVLRFPLPQFKTMSVGEIVPMIVAETEPVGSFVGESINLPVFQGGLLITYLVFIFHQNPWLGLAAIALYPPQVYLIPRLQRKINALGKERVQTARALSDRIGESVAGSAEIRANDTFHLETADISNRLGTIFGIRVDIYKRKFFVKFLNNFLAQVTPFFFYSIGGYFVIKGELSLGALVAVLSAYKDILDPWKEVLAWYSTKEDVRIKYEQIVSQFEPPGLIEGKLISGPVAEVPRLAGEIGTTALVYSEDGVINRLDRVSCVIPGGEHVALVGGGHSGKYDIAQLVARLTFPSGGRIVLAGMNLADVHQAVPGRRIAYAAQNAYIFSGSLAHNLYYGLKHQPLKPATYDEAQARLQATRVRDALAAGNSPHDVRADWIDYGAVGVTDADQLKDATLAVLRLVDMEQEVINFGLASTLDARANPAFAAMVLEARGRIRERVRAENLSSYVELFDPNAYHSNISVGENLLFGTPRHASFQPANLPSNPEFVQLLRDVGLLDELYKAGAAVAGLMVELFADVAPDSPLFEQYSFISADDLPVFQALGAKIAEGKLTAIDDEGKARLLALTIRLVQARHRLGVIDEAMQRKIVEARAEFRRRYIDREDVVEFFDPDRVSSTLSVQDNILFGRIAQEHANAQAVINAMVREVATQIGMNGDLVRFGLGHEVGNGGSRLTYSERQRLAIARGLMKNPDILIFNEPTSGLDPATEMRVLRAVLGWAKGRTVVWTLGRADLAREFDRVLVLEDGRLVEQGTFTELEQKGSALPRLLSS
jgi:ABC-type multidrug transport system fused ATPase/permease subunit